MPSLRQQATQNRNQLPPLRIPELAINPLGDRIVHAFFYESKNTEDEKVDFKVGDGRETGVGERSSFITSGRSDA